MDYRPRLSQHSSPLVYPWFVTEFTCTNVDSPSVSCRIVDIGVAIRFLVAAGDRAASPRLVPAVGRPLVLAHVLLRDRSHELRQTATSSKCCAMESMHVHMRVCVYACIDTEKSVCTYWILLVPSGTYNIYISLCVRVIIQIIRAQSSHLTESLQTTAARQCMLQARVCLFIASML